MSQNPLDKLMNVDWKGLVKTATNKVKQYTLNLSPLEIAVEDATNMETWGPHGSAMNDIAEACFDPEGYRQVMGVLARRLQEKDEHWRMCYKALLLLEYLVKHGPMKVAEDTFTSISVLERLQRFEYKDANMRDHGANVRHRAQEIAQLVSDPTRVQEERAKAHANKAKYTGVSASAMRMGGNSSFSSSLATGGGKRFDSTMLVRPSRSSGSTTADGGFGSGLDSRAPRTSSGGGFPPRSPDGKSIGSSSRSPSLSPRNEGGSDAVAATRARIEKLKLEADRKEGQGGSKSGVHDQEAGKKKLTDVRVNPRIAASLGLKPVPQKRVDPAPAGQSAAGLVEGDLLGGLDDDTTPASQNASNGQPANAVWDAFAGTSTGPTAPGPATDPFSELASRNSATQAGGANSRAALPEDIFSDLAGLPKATPTAMVSPKVFHGPLGPQSHTPAGGFGEFSSVGDAGGVGVKVASTLAPPEKDPFADLFR